MDYISVFEKLKRKRMDSSFMELLNWIRMCGNQVHGGLLNFENPMTVPSGNVNLDLDI